jgi:hypothetical protein
MDVKYRRDAQPCSGTVRTLSAVSEPSAFEPLAYTVKQVLERVPISRSELYKEIGAGRLIVTKIGARTLFTPQALENWLAAGAVQ